MQIIPVLDLKAGQAVHAVRGEREHYAPVQGMLGSGINPIALAAAYRDRLGCSACYVADLDAIAGAPLQANRLHRLAALNLDLWIDAGISSPDQAQRLFDLGATQVIIGSETLPSADHLPQLVAKISPERLVFSVDWQGGNLRAPTGLNTPHQLITLAAQAGIRRVILLDLARVGAAAGPPLDWLTRLRPQFPYLAFYAGGGVRHRADLAALTQAGAAGALIATAFHRGDLTAADMPAGLNSKLHLPR